MKIILTGATGFAGGEVLRQALLDPEIEQVTVLTRRTLGLSHAKLKELIVSDFLDYSNVDLSGHDACIWCLGISQTQVREAEYIRITLDYTLAAARAMYAANPQLRFCFLSGRSADPEEQQKALFARIKGRAERQLAELGRPAFFFRPAYIRPTAQGPGAFLHADRHLAIPAQQGLQRGLRPTGALPAGRCQTRQQCQ